MKYGLLSLDMRHLPLEDCFVLAGRYGFDGLEIFGCRKHLFWRDVTEETLERLNGFRQKYRVEIPMYTPNAIGLPICLCSDNRREREDGVGYFSEAIGLAAKAGIARVLVVADHPGHEVPRARAFAHLVESIRALAAVAENANGRLVLEPLTPGESPVLTTAEDCMRVIEAVASPAVYAMLDVAVPTVVQEPLSNYFSVLGDRLDYVHLCNTDGKSDAHLRLESGVLPIPAVFEVLDRCGYEGYVTTELYTEGFRDPELLISDTARVLRTLRTDMRGERT